MSERLTQVTIVDKEIHKLQPGEMTQDTSGNWLIGCPGPGCGGVGNLSNHMVTESNGIITVSPSLLCGCGAHYFIENNKIRWT